MLTYPHFNPIMIKISSLSIHWYGFLYFISCITGFFFIKKRLKLTAPQIKPEQIEQLIFWIILGLLIGARLGELIFYHWMEWKYYLFYNPIEIIAIWHGGLSFHGGLIGAYITASWYIHKQKIPFLPIADAAFLATPIGLMFGRLGNFINGELFGRATLMPWGMIFPLGGPLPRHPSQLYEAILEGPLLLLILYQVRNKVQPGILIVLFLIGYSLFRFLVEFVREPTPQIGFLFGSLTTGHLLSIIQFIIGLVIWFFLSKHKKINN